MSATGRGALRQATDFYRTPRGAIQAILARLPKGGRILDAGCGDGAIVRELIRWTGQPARVRGIELVPELAALARRSLVRSFKLEPERAAQIITTGDFLADPMRPVDLVVMNPPFAHALEFIERALYLTVPRNGTVATLLRVGWLGSKGRAEFLQGTHPDFHVLSPRPSFCASMKCRRKCGWRASVPLGTLPPPACPGPGGKGCGAVVTVTTTDASEYAWFVWAPMACSRWHVLPWVPS